jgi:hypothetical protein
MTRNDSTSRFTLTQTGLIEKIATITGLTASNGNRVPAAQVTLGSDPNGEPMKESWNYTLVAGMLLFLSMNTHPDIAYVVSQVAQFTSNPHATAVKMIVWYLVSTKLFGTIMRPYSFDLDLYVDADFVSLFRREPDVNPDSAWSQTEISIPTLEAEYSAVSNALKTLLPLNQIIIESLEAVKIPKEVVATVRAHVFEDSQGAYYLAIKHQLTNQTRYFLLKFHWFWQHYKNNEFVFYKVGTKEPKANYLT